MENENRNYKLKKGEIQKLEDLLSKIDRYKKLTIGGVTIKDKMMTISVDNPDLEDVEGLNLEYELEPISAEVAKTEREYLEQEYEYEHVAGQYLNDLRWNVSRFFLGIQTVFVVAALKGLLELGKIDANSGEYTVHTPLLVWGLILLAIFNIAMCVIWCLRNLGIHSWHRAAIKRQRLIELDPRWKQMPWFVSGAIHIMKNREGLFGKVHGTGDLECWGPPAAFCCLWIGVVILAIFFSGLSILTQIVIASIIIILLLVCAFITKCILCKYKKTQKNLLA